MVRYSHKEANMADNSNNNSDVQYEHGPYIVFDDGSTYAFAEDTFIAVLTQDGEDHLNDAMDFNAVHDDDAVYISMGDLIEAYNQVHGADIGRVRTNFTGL
jgi:hypothetical protein